MTDTVRAPAAATAQGPRTSDRLGGTINPKHTDTAPPNQEFAGLPRQAVRRHRGGRPMSATCLACGSPFKPQRSTARFCGPRCRVAAQRTRNRGTPIRMAATRPGVAAGAVLSVTAPVGMSGGQKPQSVTLRRRPPRLDPRIVPDEHWPGMFRIRRPDGSLSDMANLTRCRDALRSFDKAAAS